MLRHNFCWSEGRLVKLLLVSTLLDKSPLTYIYFTTFESKRRVRSPLPTQSNLLVFGIISPFFDYMSIEHLQSYRHQICDFEMRVNEMLAIVALYYN